ncbi:MAG: hypothetical protein AAGU76_09860 [Sedimentibacter sp.]|uniref:hypothetical protein n=1 Tax=Sedimentibacter sp. TaxID=1960295 RepID=UPI0031594965
MKINITDEALKQLKKLDIRDIRILFHGTGCGGGPVLSMVKGKPNGNEDAFTVQNFIFAVNNELVEKYKTIDIDYLSGSDEFEVEADSSGGCIRCNGCWLNTIRTDFTTS